MSDYNPMNDQTPKPKRHGWKIAVAIISVVLAGALLVTGVAAGVLLVRYLPNSSLKNWIANETALPKPTLDDETKPAVTQPAATTRPEATLPPIGGKNTLSLTDGINIPAIVKADSPAVVGVLNKVKGQFSFGNRSNNNTEQTQGSGSGIIFSTDGYIVTNNHVVEGADELSVVLSTGEEVKADLVGADRQTDLAVLKINKTGLTAIPFGNSDNVEVGETVLAIGNPLGTDLAGTVTAGIVSAKNRELTVDGYSFKLIQTDAAINPGNSGGALVNMNGELIGINQLKSTSAGSDQFGNSISAEGIGFAIPISTARPIIEQLIQHGGIERPVLGISSNIEITPEQAESEHWKPGIGINAVAENGPAAKAGIQAGDIITEFDGVEAKTLTDIRNVLNKHKIGDTVKVKVFRTENGQELTLNVTLGNSMDVK